jgi:hypothetical protein
MKLPLLVGSIFGKHFKTRFKRSVQFSQILMFTSEQNNIPKLKIDTADIN